MNFMLGKYMLSRSWVIYIGILIFCVVIPLFTEFLLVMMPVALYVLISSPFKAGCVQEVVSRISGVSAMCMIAVVLVVLKLQLPEDQIEIVNKHFSGVVYGKYLVWICAIICVIRSVAIHFWWKRHCAKPIENC